MQIIHDALLDDLSVKALNNPRLRINYNFHDGSDSPSQRMLNALEMGTVMTVHRHRHTAETYVLLRGRIRVIFYNQDRLETESMILDVTEGNYGVNIPLGQWHSLEVMEGGSVIFEAKDGPYTPLSDEDILKPR